MPRPPRIPAGAARPGRRGETPSDNLLTAKIERVRGDATPAPLPPSPGARDAEVWFEQVPTNPALDHLAPADVTAPQRRTQRSSKVALLGGGTSVPTTFTDRSWLLPALIAAIALTIGMILGALLFSKDAPACPVVPAAQGVPKQ